MPYIGVGLCVNVITLALGSWPKQGLARLRAKKGSPGVKKMWGNEPSHSQRSFHLGSWSPSGFLNVQRMIVREKTQWIEDFFISLKNYWNLNVWNRLAWPIWNLKHKLWPKEGPRVKLPTWLPTTKNRESTWFPCVQVTCNIPLESSRQGLQLFLRPHFNWRSACKGMRPESRGSPNFTNFRISIWKSQDKMPFGCGPLGEAQSIL